MSREVRRVPQGWKHPNSVRGGYRPLYDGAGLTRKIAEWEAEAAKWLAGLRQGFTGEAAWTPHDRERTLEAFADWNGGRPRAEDHMPEWPEEQRTHLQMYESVTEGTPISPVMATPEELAAWLAANRASAFAGVTATYDQWLAMIRAGSSVGSAVRTGGQLISGVAAVSTGKKAT